MMRSSTSDTVRRLLPFLAGIALLFGAQQAHADSLYGISSATESVYLINQSNGSATFVAKVNGNVMLSGGSFLNGSLYASSIFGAPGGGNGAAIGIVRLTSGAFVFVSNQGGSLNWWGLASDESAGLLYSIDYNDNYVLKSMTAAGVITSIGTGTGIDGRGMAFDDANDILYATGGTTFSTSLYRVSTVSGTATAVGPMGTGFTSPSDIGLAYDESNDILYAISDDGDDGPFSPDGAGSSLYTVNTATGAATLVGTSPIAAIDGLAWTVPEPSDLALARSCVVALIAYGWWRRTR
jgi:hypothetical protein